MLDPSSKKLGQTANLPSSEDYLARGFRNVDSADAGKMARCLTVLDGLPSFRQYKESILDVMSLSPGAVTADLGCGLGFDVFRLTSLVGPAGRAIGIDSSAELLASARARNADAPAAEFIQADIRSLPLENNCFDSCKVDRTLQHVKEPMAVLAEIFRTLRPGGIVVCAEPDWATFVIDHPEHSAGREIADFWAESFQNPWIGRELRNHLQEAGFVEIETRGALLIAPSFEISDQVFDIVRTADSLAVQGNVRPLAWIADARERDHTKPVWSCVTLFIHRAQKPR